MSPNGNQVPTMIFPMRMFDRQTGKPRVFFGQDEYDMRAKDRYSDERPHVSEEKPAVSTKRG